MPSHACHPLRVTRQSRLNSVSPHDRSWTNLRPGGSTGREGTIMVRSLPQRPGFDSCQWSFALLYVLPPIAYTFLSISLYNKKAKNFKKKKCKYVLPVQKDHMVWL